jgi:hypothetical protein
MRYLALVFLVISILACNSNKERSPVESKDTTAVNNETALPAETNPVKDPITDTLMKLPFIIQSNRYIDSISSGQKGIAFLADTADGIISVKAGYNGEERFETYYDFSIDPRTFDIKILDIISGEYISLAEYIKKNRE